MSSDNVDSTRRTFAGQYKSIIPLGPTPTKKSGADVRAGFKTTNRGNYLMSRIFSALASVSSDS